MFGMGWSEIILVGIVALIVVGPRDFPKMFRTLGQVTGKARGMAREFSKAMEAAADDSGIKDISKTIKAAANPTQFGTNALKDAAGLGSKAMKPGGATEALSKERAENKAKIDEAMATSARNRQAKEAAAAEAPAEVSAAAPIAEDASATPATPAAVKAESSE